MDRSRHAVIASQYTHWRGNPFLHEKGGFPCKNAAPGRRFCMGMTVTMVLRVFCSELYPARSPYGLRFVSMPP